MPKLAMTNIIT